MRPLGRGSVDGGAVGTRPLGFGSVGTRPPPRWSAGSGPTGAPGPPGVAVPPGDVCESRLWRVRGPKLGNACPNRDFSRAGVNVDEVDGASESSLDGPCVADCPAPSTSVTPGMCTPGPAMFGNVPRRRGRLAVGDGRRSVESAPGGSPSAPRDPLIPKRFRAPPKTPRPLRVAGPPELGAPDVGAPELGTPDVGAPELGASGMCRPEAGAPDTGDPSGRPKRRLGFPAASGPAGDVGRSDSPTRPAPRRAALARNPPVRRDTESRGAVGSSSWRGRPSRPSRGSPLGADLRPGARVRSSSRASPSPGTSS
jgi:hypothetical protein